MPPTVPATFVATGYGNSNHLFELYSIEAFTISVERCHPSFLILSIGYTLAAIAFFPLGKFILAASQTNAFEAAHATSLASVSYTHLRAHETGRNLVCR